MFGIKNLLKISLGLLLFFIVSCKPKMLPEEIKEAFGYYAYNSGDTVNLIIIKNDSITDTMGFYLSRKYLDIQPSYGLYDYEDYILRFYDYRDHYSIFVEYTGGYDFTQFYMYKLAGNNLAILNYFNSIKIDNKYYTDVYYLKDTVNFINIYSSRNYGFIRVWNDTVVYKIERVN